MSSISTSVALGNPVRSRTLRGFRNDEEGGIVMRSFQLNGSISVTGEDEVPDSGATFFVHQGDPARYETGHVIIVSYSWNRDEPECVENDVLREESHLDIKTFRNEILNKINTLLPVTPVDIRTVKGVLTVTQLPRHIPRNMVYPSIPDSLAYIPVVPLSDLRMCLVSTLHPNIDIVTRTGDITESWYAFKRYAIPLEKQDLSMDVLLSDVEHLSRLDSPYIMKPSFVVTDTSDPSLFRGYLTPFMPAGTLEDVFEELLVKGITACTTQILSDITSVKPFEVDIFEERERRTAATMKQATSPPNLAWSLKHTWAIEGARALATLHNSAIYSGDVKLNNILLDRNGHLRFIDVAPQEGYTDPYLAPEFHALACDVDLPLTEARDIYAFGIVLWQIAEEVGRIDVEDPSKAIDLVWRSDSISGSTPHWFRDLATRCVDSDPTKRPSAKFVMDVLEYNQSMWGTFTRLISDISHWVQGYWYGI